MTRHIAALVVVFAFGLPAFADRPKDQWLDSYDAAVRAAGQTHKPILLIFRCER